MYKHCVVYFDSTLDFGVVERAYGKHWQMYVAESEWNSNATAEPSTYESWYIFNGFDKFDKFIKKSIQYDDVIKWKHFPRYRLFVRGIHRSPVNSPHKGQWRGALMLSLICAWINGWVNNREARDLRRHSAHYDVIVMISASLRDSYGTTSKWWTHELQSKHENNTNF